MCLRAATNFLLVSIVLSVFVSKAISQETNNGRFFAVHPHGLVIKEIGDFSNVERAVLNPPTTGSVTFEYEEKVPPRQSGERVSVSLLNYRDNEELDSLEERFPPTNILTETRGKGETAVEIHEEIYWLQTAVLHLIVVTPAGKKHAQNKILASLNLTLTFPPTRKTAGIIKVELPKPRVLNLK